MPRMSGEKIFWDIAGGSERSRQFCDVLETCNLALKFSGSGYADLESWCMLEDIVCPSRAAIGYARKLMAVLLLRMVTGHGLQFTGPADDAAMLAMLSQYLPDELAAQLTAQPGQHPGTVLSGMARTAPVPAAPDPGGGGRFLIGRTL